VSDQQYVSVTGAVRWLAARGIKVHQNTVRHWYQSGRIQVRRRTPQPTDQRGRRAEILIPVDTLRKMTECPYCASRQ
jgi:hypothetical protein